MPHPRSQGIKPPYTSFCLPKRASLNLPAPGAPRSVSLPRSSTVLLTPRAPSTSKTLARGWYDFGKIDTRYHFRKVDARCSGRQRLPEGKAIWLWRGRKRLKKELLRACLPFLRSHAHASLGLSATLPSLDALPLGSFREPSPFDCTVILQTDLHTEPLPLSSVTLNPRDPQAVKPQVPRNSTRSFLPLPIDFRPTFSGSFI